MIKFPCQVCEKSVDTNHNAICCDMCDCCVHIHCNNIYKQTYRQLQKDPSPWYCKRCLKEEILFSNLNDSEFEVFTSGLSILPKKKDWVNQQYSKKLMHLLKMKKQTANITQ